MAFDRRAGRLVALTDTGDGAETWTFDVCRNTWAQMRPNREPPGFDWAELVYDVDSDVTIVVSSWERDAVRGQGGEVWAYDLQADTWTENGTAPTIGAFLAYDPATGLVVAALGPDLWSYDVEMDTWTPIHQANAGPDNVVIAYDASVDRLVAYGDAPGGVPPYETWLLDIRTGTWSRSAAERPAVVGWYVAPGIVYDEAAEQTVILRRSPLTAYDTTEDRWEILAAAETPVGPNLMVYDPVNRRLVGWGDQTWGPPGAVAALDLVTGEWTVLLEPSEGQPAASSE
jgi:hypothetical protein